MHTYAHRGDHLSANYGATAVTTMELSSQKLGRYIKASLCGTGNFSLLQLQFNACLNLVRFRSLWLAALQLENGVSVISALPKAPVETQRTRETVPHFSGKSRWHMP